jgi:hypothetical protein
MVSADEHLRNAHQRGCHRVAVNQGSAKRPEHSRKGSHIRGRSSGPGTAANPRADRSRGPRQSEGERQRIRSTLSQHTKLTIHVPTQLPTGTGTTVLTQSCDNCMQHGMRCTKAGPIAITCTYTICPVTAPHGCGESHAAVLCGASDNTHTLRQPLLT